MKRPATRAALYDYAQNDVNGTKGRSAPWNRTAGSGQRATGSGQQLAWNCWLNTHVKCQAAKKPLLADTDVAATPLTCLWPVAFFEIETFNCELRRALLGLRAQDRLTTCHWARQKRTEPLSAADAATAANRAPSRSLPHEAERTRMTSSVSRVPCPMSRAPCCVSRVDGRTDSITAA